MLRATQYMRCSFIFEFFNFVDNVSFFLSMLRCRLLLLFVFFFLFYFKFCQEQIFQQRHIVAMCVYPEIDTILYLVWSQLIDVVQSIWDHRYVNYTPQFCQLNAFNLSSLFWFHFNFLSFYFISAVFPFIFQFNSQNLNAQNSTNTPPHFTIPNTHTRTRRGIHTCFSIVRVYPR